MPVHIYALTHKESDKVYIGKTKHTLAWRLGCHIRRSRQEAGTPLRDWIRSHLDNPEGFEMQVVEEVDEQEWEEAERAWIAWFHRNYEGVVLNVAVGGEGAVGAPRPSGKDHWFFGCFGENHPASKLTDMEVDNIRRRYSHSSVTQRELADEFDVSRGHISHLVRGTTRGLM